MHHRGGRDGGIFLGVKNTGAAVIQDNRVTAFSQLALGSTPASMPATFRIEVTATWQAASRDYLLAVKVRDGTSDAMVSQTATVVAPYTVLGNIGLFSHPATGHLALLVPGFHRVRDETRKPPRARLRPRRFHPIHAQPEGDETHRPARTRRGRGRAAGHVGDRYRQRLAKRRHRHASIRMPTPRASGFRTGIITSPFPSVSASPKTVSPPTAPASSRPIRWTSRRSSSPRSPA